MTVREEVQFRLQSATATCRTCWFGEARANAPATADTLLPQLHHDGAFIARSCYFPVEVWTSIIFQWLEICSSRYKLITDTAYYSPLAAEQAMARTRHIIAFIGHIRAMKSVCRTFYKEINCQGIGFSVGIMVGGSPSWRSQGICVLRQRSLHESPTNRHRRRSQLMARRGGAPMPVRRGHAFKLRSVSTTRDLEDSECTTNVHMS